MWYLMNLRGDRITGKVIQLIRNVNRYKLFKKQLVVVYSDWRSFIKKTIFTTWNIETTSNRRQNIALIFTGRVNTERGRLRTQVNHRETWGLQAIEIVRSSLLLFIKITTIYSSISNYTNKINTYEQKSLKKRLIHQIKYNW